MALRTDISKCKNWEELNTQEHFATTQALYFATMIIDMGEITEINYGVFYARVKVYETISGEGIASKKDANGWQLVGITLADIQRRIGLSTNVTNRTATQFFKRMELLTNDDWHDKVSRNKMNAVYFTALAESEVELANV